MGTLPLDIPSPVGDTYAPQETKMEPGYRDSRAAHIRAQQTAQQAFSRLLGRSTAREGVLAIRERPPRPHVECEDRKGTVIYESEITTW